MTPAGPPSPPASGTPYGFVEWFRPGEYERTEALLPGLLASGATHLRTHLSWAEYHTDAGQAWYDWLFPRLGPHIEVLPCIHYTPPSLSRTGRSSGAPRDVKAYADFVDHVLDRHGRHFASVELWNEPNNLLDWDWRADPGHELFCAMVGGAAHWVRRRGWRAVLGGPCPFDASWLELMGARGVLAEVGAVGLHGFPGTWDSEAGGWPGWPALLAETRAILARHGREAEVWITEAGHSTWRHDGFGQVTRFLEALDAGAERLYWYSWADVPSDIPVQEGLWFDPRHYHLGVVDARHAPKLLARGLMEGGVERLRAIAALAGPADAPSPKAPAAGGRAEPVVITGGGGFIGCNLADSFLREGADVIVLDTLARAGVERNIAWLREDHGARVHLVPADVRDGHALRAHVKDARAVIHLAAQTAVTTSLEDPCGDFAVNAGGTLALLEAVRATGGTVPLLFASTNKVYGALDDLAMTRTAEGYRPEDRAVACHGVGEDAPLDLCTPYGCSKGVADQYVLDHARQFGLRTAVLRMSCIYGPHQFGTEDQGWVAHFLLQALRGAPVSVYGDGRQVRDLLHVGDAVAAYRAVLGSIDRLSGQAFNLGGGPANAVSVATALGEIARITGRPLDVSTGPWRQGDQRYFVADTRRLARAVGWAPTVPWRLGLAHLAEWLARHRLPASGRRVRSAVA